MNNRLKDYIDHNKDAFDSLEAPAGAWASINEELHGKKKIRLSIIRYGTVAIAAALIGVFVYMGVMQQAEPVLTAEETAMTEMELYYITKVNRQREKVYQVSDKYPELKSEMDKDLAELDTIMIELKRDLDDNVDNAEVVEAMIQNYRMKLTILEDIMLFLEDQKEDNEPTHTSYAL